MYNHNKNTLIIWTEKEGDRVINYSKLLKKLKEKGITTYKIRKMSLIQQSTLSKIKMCSGENMDEINDKLEKYKDNHENKEFMYHVSTKTIEEMCQLLQCQPSDLMEWKVELDPKLAYENRLKEEEGQ